VVLNPTTTNTYTGTTGVVRGIARLGKTDALPTGTVLDVDSVSTVADAAQFDLAGFNQTVAALQDTATTNVNGVVSNSAASLSTLTVNGSQTTEFNGVIQNGAGTVALTKDGSGSLRLSGVNTYSGATNVDGGTLLVSGSISGSAVTVTDGGTLGGIGATGPVTATTGATISPGLSPGILNVGALAMSSGSVLSIEINGLTVSTEYDQLSVTGTVDITGATLTLGGTYLTAPVVTYDLFTILLNDGSSDLVTGTFTGLAEGTLFTAVNGQDFTISYIGGDGNDIVLTAVPEPGSAALILGGLSALVGLRRRRRA
jgi:autotransporter-associated beta strand protein